MKKSARPVHNSKTNKKIPANNPVHLFGLKRYSRPKGWKAADFGFNLGGRPRVFPTADKLETTIQEYFELCEKRELSPGVFGLSLFLGTTYDVFLMYQNGKYDNDKENYSKVLKRARIYIAYLSESRLESGSNPAGSIFHLQQLTRGMGEQWKNVAPNEDTQPRGDDGPIGPTIILPDNGRNK